MSSPPPLNRDSSWESNSSGKITTSSSNSNKPRSHHAPSRRLTAPPVLLKPIAAKPPSLAKRWQPLPAVNRTAVQKAVESVPPRKLLVCTVCGRPGCQLVSHRTFVSRNRKEDEESAVGSNFVLITDEVYMGSYVFRYRQAYVDSALAQGRIDPFHSLPLPSDLNTSENHSLFHYYFSFETKQGMDVPKPSNIIDDLILDPFLVPAMQDPTLCLSVLALAAAQLPTNQGLPPDHVRSLELGGRAMSQTREQAAAGEPSSDFSIIGHGFLWALSLFIMDKTAMQSYADSVHLLVRTRGGLKKLGLQGFVETFIRWIDARHSLVTHTATAYEDAPESLPLTRVPVKKYGSFWESKQATEILSRDVLEACCGVCRTIEVIEDSFTNGMPTRTYVWLMGSILFTAAPRSRVLELHEGTSTLNECVISANELILQFAADNVIKQKNAVLFQAFPLVKALQNIDKQYPQFLACSYGETELLMWVLFVVFIVPHDFEGKDWISAQLCHIICNVFAEDGKLPPDWADRIFQSFARFTWSDLKTRKLFDAACLAIKGPISARK